MSKTTKGLENLPNSSVGFNLYDNVAAQNAFFNAPKVTLRSGKHKKTKIKDINDEEEVPELEIYDENADRELNEKIAQHLKDFFAKKITTKNAFETPILDKLPTMAQMEPLQCVGAMLDASARVYAFRVDNTHCECFTVRTTIDEDKKKKSETANSSFSSNKHGEGDEEDDEGDGSNDTENDENVACKNDQDGNAETVKVTKKKKKKGFKGLHDSELPNRLEDFYKKSVNLVDHFLKSTLPSQEQIGDGPITSELLIENFESYSIQVHDIVASRRVGVPFIEQKMLGLNRNIEEYSIDDPIYHKVAKQFEEGCAQSFVNNEVLTNNDGSFLILHTNWKNKEPFASKSCLNESELLSKQQQNLEILQCFEGALERALAQNPCDLAMLQEFCEETDDKCENEIEESTIVRLLSRKSQEIKTLDKKQGNLPRNSVLITKPIDNNSEDETASTSSLTDDEKGRREHEELVKFQMYLEEDFTGNKDVVKDPFEVSKTSVPLPTSYLVTRFAPLIDSIWHAVIKVASEEELTKTGIFIGATKNLQRILGRQNLLKASTQKRRKPYTPSKSTLALLSPNSSTPVSLMSLKRQNMSSVRRVRQEQEMTVEKLKSSKKRPRTISKIKKVDGSTVNHNDDVDDDEDALSPHCIDSDENCLPKTLTSVAGSSRVCGSECIYFWARPRQYPIVYLGQIADDRDHPMLQDAEMCIDIEEMLLGLDEVKLKRASNINGEVPSAFELQEFDKHMNVKSSNDAAPNYVAPNKKDSNVATVEPKDDVAAALPKEDINRVYVADFSLNCNDLDIENEGDIKEPTPIEDIFDDAPLLVNMIDDNTDDGLINCDNKNDMPENTDKGIVDLNSKLSDVVVIEDCSHWKGCTDADVNMNEEDFDKKEKKIRKKPQVKAKRRRLNSDNDNGGVMTEEMFWLPADEADPETLKSIKKHQMNGKPEELVYCINRRKSGNAKLFWDKKDFPVDVAGEYDPMRLIQSELFYKSYLGFWRYTSNSGIKDAVYCVRRSNFKPQSIDEQYNEFFSFYFCENIAKPILEADVGFGAAQKSKATISNPYSLDDSVSSGEILDVEFEEAPDNLKKDNDVKEQSGDAQWQNEEHLEFNGGVIKIRQSRVKAPMVKRAISSILSSNDLSINSLSQLSEEFLKHQNNKENHLANEVNVTGIATDEVDLNEILPISALTSNTCVVDPNVQLLSISDEEDVNDGQGNTSSSEIESEEENSNADLLLNKSVKKNGGGSQELNKHVDTFKINGEHTFESLLAYLPQHLSGRTKRDLNVINTFAITLHMCNEHQIRLIQDKDVDTLLVKQNSMSSFQLKMSQNNDF